MIKRTGVTTLPHGARAICVTAAASRNHKQTHLAITKDTNTVRHPPQTQPEVSIAKGAVWMQTQPEYSSSMAGERRHMRRELSLARMPREGSKHGPLRGPSQPRAESVDEESDGNAPSSPPFSVKQNLDSDAPQAAQRSFNTASLVDYFNSTIKRIEQRRTKARKDATLGTTRGFRGPSHSNRPTAAGPGRISDENTQARRAYYESDEDEANAPKRRAISNSSVDFPNASFSSARLDGASFASIVRPLQPKLHVLAGETSMAMGRAAPYWHSARDAFPRYTDHAIPWLRPRELAEVALSSFTTAEQSYTQVLIWCLSRRMSELGDAGASQVRLKEALFSLRGKISCGSLNLFGRRAANATRLQLKPTKPNPINERRAQGYEVLSSISAQLESSRRDSFSLLDAAEKQTASAIPVAAHAFGPTAAQRQLQEAQDVIQASMRQLAAQSLAIERVAEQARELIGELQNHYVEDRCDDLGPMLRDEEL